MPESSRSSCCASGSPPSFGRGPAVICAPTTAGMRCGPPAAPVTVELMFVLLLPCALTYPKSPVERAKDSARVFT